MRSGRADDMLDEQALRDICTHQYLSEDRYPDSGEDHPDVWLRQC